MEEITEIEKLEQEIYDCGIELIDYPFHSDKLKGLTLICDDKPVICISKKIKTTKERKCILSEELSHYKNSPNKDITNDHQKEKQARFEGYKKLIPYEKLIEAINNNITEIYELAEHFEVTEQYMLECIEAYKNKYNIK